LRRIICVVKTFYRGDGIAMSEKDCSSDSECSTCGSTDACSQAEKQAHEQQAIDKNMENVRHKFMVLSGKGGVGKSSVSVNIAAALAAMGNDVGILDADIHGPNVPKMLGVDLKRPGGSDSGMLPVLTSDNLRVMSIGFFLRSADDAVIWRGPMKHGVLKQFFSEVYWGALDYLVMDLPPGTGDEALSISHLIKNVDGAIIVTTPQDVALLDSRKSINFCKELKIPRICVVENMSGMTCPHCQQEINLFKTGGGERIARDMKVPFLGRIPLDPEMVKCTDDGRPLVNAHPESPAASAFREITKKWIELLEQGPKKPSFIAGLFKK
jgi:ATP-binding protein involved in chromosome partitioning